MKTALHLLLLSLALGLLGCNAPEKFAWLPREAALVEERGVAFDVVIQNGPGCEVLRTRARNVPAGLDLREVARRMENTMNAEEGVGIAAPQVGLSLRLAVLMNDYKTENPYIVVARNPMIVERSDETAKGYEGCLSVPDVGGLVSRNCWICVEYEDLEGKPRAERYEGPNAVLWQHEIDHLDGVLYVDRVIGDLLPFEEVRRLRKEAEGKE